METQYLQYSTKFASVSELQSSDLIYVSTTSTVQCKRPKIKKSIVLDNKATHHTTFQTAPTDLVGVCDPAMTSSHRRGPLGRKRNVRPDHHQLG